MNIYKKIQENQEKLMLWGPIGIILFITAGCLILPRIFYDNFIWKYFWGPIIEDAENRAVELNGIEAAEKFTLISELIYGLMVIIFIYWLYKLSKKWNIEFDFKLVLGILPFIIYGVVTRVFEDSGFFGKPLIYHFVTPLIYIETILIVVFVLILGHFLQEKIKNKYVTIANVMFVSGMIFLTPCLYFLGRWFLGDKWGSSTGDYFNVFFTVVGILLLVIIGVLIFVRIFKDNKKIQVYKKPINLILIIGHLLDGLASWISIYDPFMMGLPVYTEKHPASEFLMEIWPPLFPIVKFLLVVIIIYVFDILYKEDLKKYSKVVNILKLFVFLLGFAPGLRDLLRVMMGV